MTPKRKLAIVVLVVVAGLALGRLRPRGKAANQTVAELPPIRVATARVARAPLSETVSVGGTLQAAQRVTITAQMPARVMQVPVAEGQAITPGQLLILFDETELRDNLARATAGVAAAQAQVSKATVGLDMAVAAGRAQAARAAGGTRAAAAAVTQARLGTRLSQTEANAALADAQGALAAALADQARAAEAVALTTAQIDGELAAARGGLVAAEADLKRATAGATVAGAAAEADRQRAQAGLAAAEANLQRVTDGASAAERDAAQAQVAQAVAGRDHLRKEVADLTFLYENGGLSGDALNGVKTQLQVAEAQVEAARAQLRRVEAGASAGERSAARAQVDEARAGLAAAEAALGRKSVSEAEIAAARAAVERARSGVAAIESTRAGRLAVVQQQASAAAAQVARAEAGVKAAEEALQRVGVGEAQEAAARANLDMARAGQAEASVGQQQAALQIADLTAARAGLAEALASERLARGQLAKAVIASPVAGTVAELRVAPGDTVLPGMPLAVVETIGATELVALVTPEQRTRLAVGQAAEISVEGSDRRYGAQVHEVADVAESDGRTFKVRLVVGDPALAAGLRATAVITVDTHPTALTIPAGAVQLADGGEAAVFLVAGDQVRRTLITLGLRNTDHVEVVSGLAEGDEIVTEGASGLFDGATIAVRSTP